MADSHGKLWSFKGRGDKPRPTTRSFIPVPSARAEATGETTFNAGGGAMNELERRARAAVETQPETVYPPRSRRVAPVHRGACVSAKQRAGGLGEQTLLELIGPLDQVPYLAVAPSSLLDLPVDHRTGFLLAEVDGRLDLESLVDVSEMPRLHALRILFQLLEDGIVRVR